MTNTQVRRLAGLLLIVAPVLFTVCFTLLQMQFEYPDILRQPTELVLAKFAAGGTGLIAIWYTITLSALLFVPTAVLVHQTLSAYQPPAYLWVATTFGVLAGLVQTLGFIRWPFWCRIWQHLPGPGQQRGHARRNRGRVRGVQSLCGHGHRRASRLSLHGHLDVPDRRRPRQDAFHPRVARRTGHGPGARRCAGRVRGVGWEFAGPVNAISYLLWAVWLVIVGVQLLRRKS